MQMSWKIFWRERRNRNVLLVSLLALFLTLFSFIHFLTFNETRSGFHFNDPVLALFKPMAVSEITFFLTYLLSIYGLIVALQDPRLFIRLIQAYVFMTLMRMVCLYLLPLEAPASIIPLKDSFLQLYFYSGRDNLKDLFFSGHTATLFLFVFTFENKRFKNAYAIGAIVVGMLLVLQHVHYSIDVLAAPVFAYLGVVLQKKINC